MMQCKTKSENLAHILGYQFWAVAVDPTGLAVDTIDPRTCERGTLGTAARDPFFVGVGGDEE